MRAGFLVCWFACLRHARPARDRCQTTRKLRDGCHSAGDIAFRTVNWATGVTRLKRRDVCGLAVRRAKIETELDPLDAFMAAEVRRPVRTSNFESARCRALGGGYVVVRMDWGLTRRK